MGRLGRLPDTEDERLSSLAGREEAMPASARNHNEIYMEYLAGCEVAGRADQQRSVMMPSTLGELRIDKQPRQHPGKAVAGRATCEEALETLWTSSLLCTQPLFYTRNCGQVVLYSLTAHLYSLSKFRNSPDLASMSGIPDPSTFV